MESIRQYLISVTGAAIICGCVTGILGSKGTIGSIAKFLCGLFMTVTVFSPLVDFRLPDLGSFMDSYQAEADLSIADAEKVSHQMKTEIITEQVRSYILDKADSMGLSISVEVSLDDALLPNMVIIKGEASPYAKSKLADHITENLGIPEEKLLWT